MSVGRNDPCPCGSGKKYKKCCGLAQNKPSAGADYGDALKLYESGNLPAAMAACQRVLAKNPAHHDARHLVGVIHYNLGVARQQQGALHEALSYYAKALEQFPDEPDIHANMGTAYYELGDGDHTLQHYLKYLSRVPEDLPIQNRVAALLVQQGDMNGAESHYRAVLAYDPRNLTAIAGLARVHEQCLDVDAAIGQYQRVLDIKDNPDERLRLLALMIRRGQLDEVARQLVECLDRYPGNHEFHYLLADVYRQQGNEQKADDVYRALLAAYPDDLQIRLHWAQLKESLHQLEGAGALIDEILQRCPDEEEALLLQAKILRRQKRFDEAESVLNKAVPAGDRTDAYSVNYYFELGTLLDRCGQYDEAFGAMSRANLVNREFRQNRFDQSQQTRAFEHVKEVLGQAVLSRFPECEQTTTGTTPVFVVGFPRSGTTLLEQMLASHPEITAGDELPLMTALENHYCQTALGSRHPYPDCLADVDIECDVVNSMRDFYLQGAAGYGLPADENRFFTDKMPLNLLYLGLIHLLFPDSPIIHIHRHPLDACLSAFFTNFSVGNRYAMKLEDTAFYYAQVMSLVEHYKQHMEMNYLEIRYEDLVTNNEPTLRRVLDFIGVPWDSRCLDYHRTARVSKTSSYEQVTQALYTTSIGRYRHYLKHIEVVTRQLRPLITAFGYRLDS